LILQAEEISDSYDGKPVHMNAVNLRFLIPPQHGSSVTETINNTSAAIKSQEESLNRPLFYFINHPNFGWAMTWQNLAQAVGFEFFEVYNGHPSVRNYGDSLHQCTEDQWDKANIERLTKGIPVLMGVATDDAHNYHEIGTDKANPGRGWVMVRAGSLENDMIIRALKTGDFYSSTGVILEDFKRTPKSYSLKIRKTPGVQYTTRFIGCRKGDNKVELFDEIEGTVAKYRFKGDELFIRAKVVSSKPKSNPFNEGDVEVAWLQPFVL
ncbi:MAG: hypothetical protein JSV24_02580, partial [Bacteroidales bacterium]